MGQESKNILKGYHNLIAWQKGNGMAHMVYDITQQFPKEEVFGITSQMRRAALSVCANIAEGYTRKSSKDRKHFYQISIGSLAELEFFLEFCFARKYIKLHDFEKLSLMREETGRLLTGLIKSLDS